MRRLTSDNLFATEYRCRTECFYWQLKRNKIHASPRLPLKLLKHHHSCHPLCGGHTVDSVDVYFEVTFLVCRKLGAMMAQAFKQLMQYNKKQRTSILLVVKQREPFPQGNKEN